MHVRLDAAPPAARFVLVEVLCGDERVTEHDPFGSDSELAGFRFVSARAGLQDGEGAPNGSSVARVLEQHDVVAEVRDAELRAWPWKGSGSSEVMNTLTPWREKRWTSEYMYSRNRISSGEASLSVQAVDEDTACAGCSTASSRS